MSQPTGLFILGDHLFFNYKKNGQRGLINTAGNINPNLTLTINRRSLQRFTHGIPWMTSPEIDTGDNKG